MSSDDSSLLFRHPSRRVRRTPLRKFLGEVTAKIARGRSITCLIADDRELRRLNGRFRGEDYATDVLSFPSDTGGEIAISFDRAALQAAEHGHSPEDELRILMLHGVLHLTGMDHEKDSGQMAKTEVRWRKRLGLPAGLTERTT